MAGELGGEARTNRGVVGLGFMGGVFLALDAMSTLNSSPWTHETFGGDPGKAQSAQRYVRMSIVTSTGLAVLSSAIMGSISPLVGSAVGNAGLFYVYWQAGSKAASKGH